MLEERSPPDSSSDIGSTAQYQPEPGSENRRSPRLGRPTSLPSPDTLTEPIRLNRCADRRLSKPRSLDWRYSVEITVRMTISARIAQPVENAITRKASERGPTVAASDLSDFLSPVVSASGFRFTDAIAHAAHGLDHVDAHLLP